VPSDGLPIPQRYLSMAVIVLGISMSVLDGSIVNLALPRASSVTCVPMPRPPSGW
jgi:hypothetical protein